MINVSFTMDTFGKWRHGSNRDVFLSGVTGLLYYVSYLPFLRQLHLYLSIRVCSTQGEQNRHVCVAFIILLWSFF